MKFPDVGWLGSGFARARIAAGISMSALVSAFCISASRAAAPATNVWTGAGNDFYWSNMDNWANAAGGAPVACGVGCVWDLTAFPANGTLVNDYSGTGTSADGTSTQKGTCIYGLVFAPNQGTVTITSADNNSVVRFPAGNKGADHYTYITIPSGTIVDFQARHTDDWRQFYMYFGGGGTFKINGYFLHSTVARFFLKDVTFVVGAGWNAASSLAAIQMQSDNSKLVFEQDRNFSRIYSNPTTVHPTIEMNGHVCNLREWNDTLSAQFLSTGTLGIYYGGENRLTGGFSGDCGPMALNFYEGDLHLGSAESPASAPDGSTVSFLRNSRLWLYDDQNLASLSSTTPEGAVSIAASSTLTISGSAATTNKFAGYVTGGGGLEVSGGSGYEIRMSGANDYAGPTRIVSGTVKTRRPKYAEGLVAYWDFDEDDTSIDAQDRSSARPLTFTTYSTSTSSDLSHTPTVVSGGAGGGKCLHFDASRCENLKVLGGTTERFHSMSNDYTIIMYIKPDGSTMVDDIDDPDAVRDPSRPNSTMNLYYNGWTAYRMNWIRFQGKKRIALGGFQNNDYGDAYINFPSADTVFDGAWHQFALTFNRASRKLNVYLDGEQVLSKTRTIDFSLDTSQIILSVRVGHTTTELYDGYMDNIQLWNRTLTADEIKEDWARKGHLAGASTLAKPAPLAWWKFDDSSNPGLDSSGNGFHLAKVNGDGWGIVTKGSDLCPGVNGLAVQIPALNSGKGSHLALVDPPAPFPSGKDDFTVFMRAQDMLSDDGVARHAFWMGGDPVTHSGNQVDNYITFGNNSQWPTYKYFNYCSISWSDYNPLSFFHQFRNNPPSQPGARGMWWTFAVVYNQSKNTVKLYREGNLVYSLTWNNGWQASAGLGDNVDFYIGYNPKTGNWKPQFVDECRIYGYAMTAAEVAEISRELANSGGTVTDSVLPDATALEIGAAGTLSLDSNERFSSISGTGTLDLYGSDITVTNASTFAGTVKGGGTISIPADGGLSLTGNGGNYTGRIRTSGGAISAGASFANATVAIEENTVFSTDGAGTGMPLVSHSGKLVLPSVATVSISSKPKSRQRIVLASGTAVETADGGLSGWTVLRSDESYKARIGVEGGELVLHLLPAGFAVMLK